MQQKQNNRALIWFRNNLRVHDNTSIFEALKNHNSVLALYCFDPRHFRVTQFGFKKTEKFRARFLIQTITDLKQQLSKLNIPLLIYQNTPENCIPNIVSNYNIDAVYTQKEWTKEEVLVTDNLKKNLLNSISFIENYDQFLFHPEDIELAKNEIPDVFTDFRKHLEKNSKVRTVISNINKGTSNVITENTLIPTLKDLGFHDYETHSNTAFPFQGGESNALQRLHYYFFETKKLGVYKQTRNGLIGKDFSSKFSPWLANGSLSVRTIYWEVKRFEQEYFKNESTYWLVFELIWRDYFKYISLKHQNNIFKIGGILKKTYDWNDDEKLIKNWIAGTTTEPFVNANMIELRKTGWMSNRGRQNVASFFAKALELDWRIGAAYFESMLLDYDVHSNYGNWMYVSGVGNDPRDRKFNIKLQAERYDAASKYQNVWLQNKLFE
ncbi:DASH family cryptochrome [Mariniflexile sp.]|uniref:DASH family cryptochrome n=1 Tax=Mariniflexile sp. TaxID=1979402 RepID=UPI00356403EC